MNKIQIKNVSKYYKKVAVLNDVSFDFEFGKIYGLLGRNGAGKSTLINIIMNRIFADEGIVLIDGENAKENMNVHDKIFCMSEADLYDKNLKVKDLFKWTNEFYNCFDMEKAYDYAKKFNLDTNKKFRKLSKGYQSMFKLIIALSLDVAYVIYDEPVLGLDANHRELFYQLLLQNYYEKEQTIIIATHLIEEVAHIIEKVVIINDGKIIIQKDVADLLKLGYSVSGTNKEVDEYCKDKNVVGYDQLENLKIAYILEEQQTTLETSSALKISAMSLQKLFVKLTEKEV